VKIFLGKVGNIGNRITEECLVESGSNQLEGNVLFGWRNIMLSILIYECRVKNENDLIKILSLAHMVCSYCRKQFLMVVLSCFCEPCKANYKTAFWRCSVLICFV
jgi:hypothetical protein